MACGQENGGLPKNWEREGSSGLPQTPRSHLEGHIQCLIWVPGEGVSIYGLKKNEALRVEMPHGGPSQISTCTAGVQLRVESLPSRWGALRSIPSNQEVGVFLIIANFLILFIICSFRQKQDLVK
jgi:hypothetical protein